MKLDLYELETAEAVSEDGGTGDTDVSGEAEAVSPEATPGAGAVSPEDEAASPQTADFDYDAFLARPEVQERMGAISEERLYGMLESLARTETPGELGPPPDPFESENFSADMAAWTQQREERFLNQIRQEIAPFTSTVGDFQTERVNAQVDTLIGQTAETFKIGDEYREDLAAVADGIAAGYGEQGHYGPEAAQQAAKVAGERVQKMIARAKEAGVAEYKASLGGGEQSTPYEPSVRGSAIFSENPPRDELDYVRRLNAQTPV